MIGSTSSTDWMTPTAVCCRHICRGCSACQAEEAQMRGTLAMFTLVDVEARLSGGLLWPPSRPAEPSPPSSAFSRSSWLSRCLDRRRR